MEHIQQSLDGNDPVTSCLLCPRSPFLQLQKLPLSHHLIPSFPAALNIKKIKKEMSNSLTKPHPFSILFVMHTQVTLCSLPSDCKLIGRRFPLLGLSLFFLVSCTQGFQLLFFFLSCPIPRFVGKLWYPEAPHSKSNTRAKPCEAANIQIKTEHFMQKLQFLHSGHATVKDEGAHKASGCILPGGKQKQNVQRIKSKPSIEPLL